ncbi:hypothetical protein FEM01_13715 [Pseudomonas mosselii]|uniref:Uncharacterized protein n=1 Tax=Pseudomonas mosselii TaxID=78327 RepID=A0A5R8Z374_9PSED|nr:hypothetical protein FEM01_13715 [Pseudomonas mosselii]
MLASSRVNPLPQQMRRPQSLRRTCGSGFTREEASTLFLAGVPAPEQRLGQKQHEQQAHHLQRGHQRH